MTTRNDKIKTLAGQLYDAMERVKRTSGEEFVRVREGAPEWMQEAVKAAHGQDIMPDDWRYAEVKSAAGDLHDHDGDAESAADDLEPDVYNIDRLKWLASHLERPAICDEAAREMGFQYDGESSDLLTLIGLGQLEEKRGILARLAEALEAVEE